MKTEQEYTRDLTEIRSMMERSTKFLSLTGWSGIMAGIYALAGVFIVSMLGLFDTAAISGDFTDLLLLAIAVLLLTIGTAAFLSYKNAKKNNERLWNGAARRLVINMVIPLLSGAVFILIVFSKGFYGLILPSTLIFYGLTLLNASKFTYEMLKSLGVIEIILGLTAAYFTDFQLLLWAIGFGMMHIVYGIYMHLKYQK